MPEKELHVLLDQNIPVAVAIWLRSRCPDWRIDHVNELGFAGKPDVFLYKWAIAHNAIVATYDEDFADARMYPLGTHCGVIRLRVWPTTTEQTQKAFQRLLTSVPSSEWPYSLIIIDNHKIRHRRPIKGERREKF
jgi:predicted nuclease of predicted toxin-antitoxin system